MSEGKGGRDLSVTSLLLVRKKTLILTAALHPNVCKANGGQVIFPLCIRSSSTGGPDSSTHKPTQTAEVSRRPAQGAWGSKPTLLQ